MSKTINNNISIEEQTMFVELGKIHAAKEAKEAKKRANVKEIEAIFYKYIPMEHPVNFIKNVTYDELTDIKREFGLYEEKVGFEFETKEEFGDEPFRKFLIKMYWYINHKNNVIDDYQTKLAIEEDRGNDLDKNSKETIKELEDLEKQFTVYKENNDFYKSYYYYPLFVAFLFTIQNFFFLYNAIVYSLGLLVSFMYFLTFCMIDEVYIWIGLFFVFLFFLIKKNTKKEKKEE
jgi:hypothetical protein